MSLSLLIKTPYSKLPGITTRYFSFEEPEGLNVEEGFTRLNERSFYLHHDENEKFVEKLGKENTFHLYRTFLSYFDAAQSLNSFWSEYGPKINGKKALINFKENFTLDNLESLAGNYNISLINQQTLPHANILVVEGNSDEQFYYESNSFQEIMWAMNMEEILKAHDLKYFDLKIDNAKVSLQNFNFLIYRMLQKREISMVMYEWTNIVSYTQPDFVKRISTILELITNDVKKNKKVYLSVDTIAKERDSLFDLLDNVNKKWRKYFFGIFNASDLLGLYSRHGSNGLSQFTSFSKQNNLGIQEIYEDWKENNIIPNNENFKHLFNIWHLTTTIIVFTWMRLNHTETIT
ncbi:hypothetical protein [Peribacillus frigoritolerans]|uniref:hypothetical protein n=1 Tax=Peribacillus frigoritolerans TaxID=450367 RepID=UPI0039A3AE45